LSPRPPRQASPLTTAPQLVISTTPQSAGGHTPPPPTPPRRPQPTPTVGDDPAVWALSFDRGKPVVCPARVVWRGPRPEQVVIKYDDAPEWEILFSPRRL